MNKTIKFLVLFSLITLLKTSCTKNDNNSSGVLTINPEMIVSYIGKNWDTVEGDLKNKKDYWYTTLNNGNTLAAISLPAKDPLAPALNYNLLFNLNLQNKITFIVLNCTDTLDISTGNKLFLYYYYKAFSQLQGVTYKFASYSSPQFPSITVTDLLDRLNTFNCPEASLSFHSTQMVMGASYFATSGSFNFNLSTF